MKTEPETYSWETLVRDTKEKGGEEWSGVRNYAARNHMRQMKIGDNVFIYHSGKERAIVGIAKVVRETHPDSTDDTGVWDCVDVASVQPMKRMVTLNEVKANRKLSEMVLVKHGRLSVQPVLLEEWLEVLSI